MSKGIVLGVQSLGTTAYSHSFPHVEIAFHTTALSSLAL